MVVIVVVFVTIAVVALGPSTSQPSCGFGGHVFSRPLPYTVAALFAFAMAVFYISLPPSALAPTGCFGLGVALAFGTPETVVA